jgi:hypothetical protein
MVFNATFNNISDISSMMVNFIGEGNQNTWRKTVTDVLNIKKHMYLPYSMDIE